MLRRDPILRSEPRNRFRREGLSLTEWPPPVDCIPNSSHGLIEPSLLGVRGLLSSLLQDVSMDLKIDLRAYMREVGSLLEE